MTRHSPLHRSALVAVAAGGAVGAVLRHLLTVHETSGFPWMTFGVNVVGCFLLALLPAFSFVRRHVLLPPLLGPGVLGGFTTLSTYSDQTRALVADGAALTATAYVVGTLAAGIAAVVVADRFSTQAARSEFDEEEGDL